ncbi:uncharacterized protein [Dysidea avara]|uniref:uncharacterized protein isoform X2 n=1 Tax=Dysidea avara TaxID=196820 RepID=UPI0033269B96
MSLALHSLTSPLSHLQRHITPTIYAFNTANLTWFLLMMIINNNQINHITFSSASNMCCYNFEFRKATWLLLFVFEDEQIKLTETLEKSRVKKKLQDLRVDSLFGWKKLFQKTLSIFYMS